MTQGLRQSDLLPPKRVEQVIDEVKKVTQIPPGYAAVNLASGGALTSGITTLHIRNFTMEELTDITAVREEHQVEAILKALRSMIYEDIDPMDLHEKDIEVIMATIKANWWDRYIRDVVYYKNLDGDLDDPENLGRVDILISSISIESLKPEFKEPIAITPTEGLNAGKTAYFVLPRIGTAIKAKALAIETNREDYQKLQELQMASRNKKKQLTPQQYEALDTLARKFQSLIQKYYQAQLLWGVDKKPYETMEQKLEALKTLDAQFWIMYSKAVTANCRFGFNEEVTFVNPDHENDTTQPETLTRRFLFQLMELIPSVDVSNNSGFNVSFGL